MLPQQALLEALKNAIRKEGALLIRAPKLTTRQRALADSLITKIIENPPPEIAQLTRREGNSTIKYFTLGKDALTDDPDWELY